MTPLESWTLVVCIVLPSAALVGLIVWLLWTFKVERKDKR